MKITIETNGIELRECFEDDLRRKNIIYALVNMLEAVDSEEWNEPLYNDGAASVYTDYADSRITVEFVKGNS